MTSQYNKRMEDKECDDKNDEKKFSIPTWKYLFENSHYHYQPYKKTMEEPGWRANE